MLHFHGTTRHHLKSLLAADGQKPMGAWTCSDRDNALYLWPLSSAEGLHGIDPLEGPEEAIDRMVTQAFESAQITAAVAGNDDDLIVVVYDIPEEDTEIDYSCEDMEYARYIMSHQRHEYPIKAIYSHGFNKWDSPFVISSMLDRVYFNKWALDESLEEAARAVSFAGLHRDDLFDFGEAAVEQGASVEELAEGLVIEGAL